MPKRKTAVNDEDLIIAPVAEEPMERSGDLQKSGEFGGFPPAVTPATIVVPEPNPVGRPKRRDLDNAFKDPPNKLNATAAAHFNSKVAPLKKEQAVVPAGQFDSLFKIVMGGIGIVGGFFLFRFLWRWWRGSDAVPTGTLPKTAIVNPDTGAVLQELHN